MAKRVISAFVGLVILGIVLMFYNTIVLNIAISLIAVIATYELLLATKYFDNKPISVVSLLFVATVPFLQTKLLANHISAVIFAFIAALFLIMILHSENVKIEQVGLVFMVSTLIPFSLSTLILIRDASSDHALFLLLLTMAGAWIGDTGAYFVGSLLGKNKLAPKISPNKTIEGLIGGVLSTSAFFIIMGLIYSGINNDIDLDFIPLAILGGVCTLFGVMGDLSASIIKRQCNIKDFGSIMPGHGGVLDRFDSILFVAPLMYITLMILQII
ncbi:MAG: phosphatidate cytidylyltransferase [Clostridiales bacterium]|nr:phosphatidate cytidylyltransferase [Clostridiales bacterium]